MCYPKEITERLNALRPEHKVLVLDDINSAIKSRIKVFEDIEVGGNN